MSIYIIQCYIETLSSDNKVTLRGADGYKLLIESNKYLVFIDNPSAARNCRLINESKIFTIKKATALIKNMLLAAQINHKKVELNVELINDANKSEFFQINIKTIELM